MRYVVLDTDVASKLLRDRLSPALTGRIAGAVWFVSFVTVGELWQWADARSWGRRSRGELERFLHGDFTVDATYLDVVQYRRAVQEFCTRTDRKLARHVVPWSGLGHGSSCFDRFGGPLETPLVVK